MGNGNLTSGQSSKSECDANADEQIDCKKSKTKTKQQDTTSSADSRAGDKLIPVATKRRSLPSQSKGTSAIKPRNSKKNGTKVSESKQSSGIGIPDVENYDENSLDFIDSVKHRNIISHSSANDTTESKSTNRTPVPSISTSPEKNDTLSERSSTKGKKRRFIPPVVGSSHGEAGHGGVINAPESPPTSYSPLPFEDGLSLQEDSLSQVIESTDPPPKSNKSKLKSICDNDYMLSDRTKGKTILDQTTCSNNSKGQETSSTSQHSESKAYANNSKLHDSVSSPHFPSHIFKAPAGVLSSSPAAPSTSSKPIAAVVPQR